MNYAVYIISHARADRVETYDTLRNAGYTGKIYVTVSAEDEREYCDRFYFDLLVFNKSYIKTGTDTIVAEKTESSPVYSRVFVEYHARELGLDAYIIMDDDVKNIRYRWIEENVVRSRRITKDLDTVFELYLSYMIQSNMSATSFANPMLYVGGTNGIEKRISGNREMYQIHMRNMNFDVEWKSLINNDTITELLCARMGYFLWTLPFIVYDSPKMNTLPGGMKAVYDSLPEFRRAFFATVALPSVCKPIMSKGHWVIGRNKDAAYVKVISSRYKK